MADSSAIAPRVAHNAALAAKFGLGPEYPAVTKQLEVVPFNRRSIKINAYNPSIIRFGERVLMAYRYHPQASDWQTRLQICELDQAFKVTADKPIELETQNSTEDPRLFIHERELWLSWVTSSTAGVSHVRYGKLVESKGDWRVLKPFQPQYGQNGKLAMEKNWTFFDRDGKIQFLYHAAPMVICDVQGETATRVLEDTKIPHWPFGRRAGGTPFLPFKGGFIRFWHSTLDNESNPHVVNNPARRYYLGASVYDEDLKVTGQSKMPIVRASEVSDLSETEVTQCRHYKGAVVFCSGAIAMPDGSFILSVGINDSQCALLRVTEEKLNL